MLLKHIHSAIQYKKAKKNEKTNAYSNKIIPQYKNLSRLTSRSFLLKLLIDGAETKVLGKLFHASTTLLQ